MSITSVKLLKIGGPVLAGTGGSAAVYSVVSRNSGGKGEEQIKTASAKDQEINEQSQQEQESETRAEQTESQTQSTTETVSSPKVETSPTPKEKKKASESFYSWFSGWWG